MGIILPNWLSYFSRWLKPTTSDWWLIDDGYIKLLKCFNSFSLSIYIYISAIIYQLMNQPYILISRLIAIHSANLRPRWSTALWLGSRGDQVSWGCLPPRGVWKCYCMALINQYMGFDEMYNHHHNIAVSLKMLYILKMALFFGGETLF